MDSNRSASSVRDYDACTRRDGGDLYVSVRVRARASKNAIGEVHDGHLQVRTTAGPLTLRRRASN